MSEDDLSIQPTVSHVGHSQRDAVPAPDEIARQFPHLEILDGENTHPDRLFVSKVLPSED